MKRDVPARIDVAECGVSVPARSTVDTLVLGRTHPFVTSAWTSSRGDDAVIDLGVSPRGDWKCWAIRLLRVRRVRAWVDERHADARPSISAAGHTQWRAGATLVPVSLMVGAQTFDVRRRRVWTSSQLRLHARAHELRWRMQGVQVFLTRAKRYGTTAGR